MLKRPRSASGTLRDPRVLLYEAYLVVGHPSLTEIVKECAEVDDEDRAGPYEADLAARTRDLWVKA